jgi:hypothetical protein
LRASYPETARSAELDLQAQVVDLADLEMLEREGLSAKADRLVWIDAASLNKRSQPGLATLATIAGTGRAASIDTAL